MAEGVHSNLAVVLVHQIIIFFILKFSQLVPIFRIIIFSVGEPKLGSMPFKREPEPIKEIYKNRSKEPKSGPFIEGAGAGK